MYGELTPVGPQALAGQAWHPPRDYLFASAEMVLPLGLDELPHAMMVMPLGFTRNQAGAYRLQALLSVLPRQNSYIAPEGQWLGEYIPAVLRGFPFRMAPQTQDPSRYVLAVDRRYLTDAAQGGYALFDEQGQPSAALAEMLTFWQRWADAEQRLLTACQALAQEALIVPWDLQVREGEQSKPVEGLYRIDEQRLRSLSGAALERLRDSGGLMVAYAQLFSHTRLALLQKVSVQAATYQARRSALEEKLQDAFGGDADPFGLQS